MGEGCQQGPALSTPPSSGAELQKPVYSVSEPELPGYYEGIFVKVGG